MTHESYGLISARLTNGSRKKAFFGTSQKSLNFVSFRISRGDLERRDGRNWIHAADESIIEIRMTCAQFAALSSGLAGEIPCTIERIGAEKMEDPPISDEREVVRQEFRDATKRIAEDLEKLSAKVSKYLEPNVAIKKATILEIQRGILSSISSIRNGLPYIQDNFEEYLAKSMEEEKLQDRGSHLTTDIKDKEQ